MKSILVPIDFSKAAIEAFGVAYSMAKKADAKIVALHVVEGASKESFKISGEGAPDVGEDQIFTYKLIQKARQRLQEFIQNPEFKDVTIEGELRLGNPYHGTVTILSEQNMDIVVMGTRGNTESDSLFLGSTAQKVVRYCKKPVLTMHKKPASVDFKNIVYATSLRPNEEEFSRIVKDIQKRYNATVHLLRVNTPTDFQRDLVVRAEMEKFAKSINLEKYTINVFSDLSEEEGVVYFSESINADMIAMATHGRTGFARVLAGSIAEEVVANASRPVLTYVLGG